MQNFDVFCSHKSVNYACKLLQLLGDFVSHISTGALAFDYTGDFRPPGAIAPPQMKIPGAANERGK